MMDIGVSCKKASYGRSAGKALSCPSGSEKNGALCYKPCKSGYKGVGPVCWSNKCPRGYDKCGPALCIKSGVSCSGKIAEQVKAVYGFVQEVALASAAVAAGGPAGYAVLNKAKAMAKSKGVAESANGVVDAFSMDICKS
jgi:hypothetical protein